MSNNNHDTAAYSILFLSTWKQCHMQVALRVYAIWTLHPDQDVFIRYPADRAGAYSNLNWDAASFFLIFSSGSCLLALVNLTTMQLLGEFILLSFGNLVILFVNSPMNKLITFCTHFSFICMITGVSNIAIHSAPIAYFQWYGTINLRQINHTNRSDIWGVRIKWIKL